MKIPEDWVKEKDIQPIIEAAIGKICRQSNRIVAFVFTWEEWYAAPQDSKVVVSRIRRYPNKRSNLYENDIDINLSLMGRGGNPRWVHFQRLVAQGV